MANNLPPVWRFDLGDYADLGGTFAKFLGNLNLFTLAVYNLLNGGLGFANLQRVVYRVTVLAGATTPLNFVNPLSIPPSGLSVVQVLKDGNVAVPLTSAVSVANFFYDGKTIHVLNITGLTAGQSYQLAIEVM